MYPILKSNSESYPTFVLDRQNKQLAIQKSLSVFPKPVFLSALGVAFPFQFFCILGLITKKIFEASRYTVCPLIPRSPIKFKDFNLLEARAVGIYKLSIWSNNIVQRNLNFF